MELLTQQTFCFSTSVQARDNDRLYNNKIKNDTVVILVSNALCIV